MLFLGSIYTLLASSVTFRRDKSLLFNRITIIILLYSAFISFSSLYVNYLEAGIGIYNGLFHVTATTQSFVFFISILAIIILQLSSFYPRRLHNIPKYYVSKNIIHDINLDKYDLIGEKTRIIEYPVQQWGKLLSLWDKLPNSGDALKLFIPNLVKIFHGGWTNHSGKVKSKKILEKGMGYRGSKSNINKIVFVKEQRVDGSYIGWINHTMLRHTLRGFERITLPGIPSNQNISKQLYSTAKVSKNLQHELSINNKNSFNLNPWFITGFVDPLQKALVIWGTNLTSTVGINFTRTQLAMVKLAPYQHSVIIGLLLSDGWLKLSNSRSKNARLGFTQSETNGMYFWFVFWSLSHYCSSYPLLRERTRLIYKNFQWQLFTRSMPCLTKLNNEFYPNFKKVIPVNIYNMLTPVALAHLIMRDGSAKKYAFEICTDSYSIEDVVRLMNVLIIKYELNCSLRFHGPNQPRIHIKQNSMPKLRVIVGPYMCKSMMYKLVGGKAKDST